MSNANSKGGLKRSENMTPEERSEAARKAAQARWGVKATHDGVIRIGEVEIPCYVLEDGERVIAQAGMLTSLSLSSGSAGKSNMSSNRLTRFAEGKAISPYLSVDSLEKIREPITFRATNGSKANGYPAAVLADLCYAVLNARRHGRLQGQQRHIAEACEVLMMGFAQIGIVALVDEATGYQYERARDALAEILEQYIAKEQARWVKTFPDEYFREHARLRNLNFRTDRKAPLAGKDIAEVVYARLAPGVLDELRLVNKKKKAKHHQFLTSDHGHPKLREHLVSVITIMKLSKTWASFIEKLDMVHPNLNKTLRIPETVRD